MYTTSNEQTVINLVQEFEALKHKEGFNWNDHLNNFHEIFNNLAVLEKSFADEERYSKLNISRRSQWYPHRCRMNLINAVQTEICRRKYQGSDRGNVHISKASVEKANGGPSVSGINYGRIKKSYNDPCSVCGRLKHRARDCFHRADKQVATNLHVGEDVVDAEVSAGVIKAEEAGLEGKNPVIKAGTCITVVNLKRLGCPDHRSRVDSRGPLQHPRPSLLNFWTLLTHRK